MLKKLQNEEHREFYPLPNIIRMRNKCKVQVEKSEGKRLLGSLKHLWEDNFKMGYKEIGWECVNCCYVAWDRNQWQSVVNRVINVWNP